MNKLIDDGVDGLITDYPDRLREVMAESGLKLPQSLRATARTLTPDAGSRTLTSGRTARGPQGRTGLYESPIRKVR